jgi:CHRD domain
MNALRILPCLALTGLIGCSNDNSNGQGTKTFNLTMTPANETPPCADAGTAATGTATVVVAADNSSVAVTETYSGLSGPPIMAHVHSGTSAAAGPIVLPFTVGLTSSPFSQTFTAADYVVASGAPADFATFVTALRAGGAAYTNIHTDACRPGEIRAEIQ